MEQSFEAIKDDKNEEEEKEEKKPKVSNRSNGEVKRTKISITNHTILMVAYCGWKLIYTYKTYLHIQHV